MKSPGTRVLKESFTFLLFFWFLFHLRFCYIENKSKEIFIKLLLLVVILLLVIIIKLYFKSSIMVKAVMLHL